jgi:hypothetical protein
VNENMNFNLNPNHDAFVLEIDERIEKNNIFFADTSFRIDFSENLWKNNRILNCFLIGGDFNHLNELFCCFGYYSNFFIFSVIIFLEFL